MSKKTLKIITVLSVVLAVLFMTSYVFAAPDPTGLSAKITDTDAFDDIGGRVIGALRAIGIIVAVGVLAVLGIKYMMGSAQEKAEYKKTMIPYLIGAVLIFAATQIASMVYNFATSIS